MAVGSKRAVEKWPRIQANSGEGFQFPVGIDIALWLARRSAKDRPSCDVYDQFNGGSNEKDGLDVDGGGGVCGL